MACLTLLVLSAAIVHSKLIIEKDAAFDMREMSNYWLEDYLWDSGTRINYDNTHVTQKCMEYEDFSKLCLCKYPYNNNLYYCHHGYANSNKQHHHQSHHFAAKNAYKDFMFDNEFDPWGIYHLDFHLDKGKDDSMVAEMGKYDQLDFKVKECNSIKNEFAIMWCFAKSRKGSNWERAEDTFEDKKTAAIIAAETALAEFKEAQQQLEIEKQKYIEAKGIKAKGDDLEHILERDKKLNWKAKKMNVIKLVKEHSKQVKERMDKIRAAQKEYNKKVTPLLAPGLKSFNDRFTSDTVINAFTNVAKNKNLWKLSKHEITFLVWYVMEDPIASATRAYWRDGGVHNRYPNLRDLVYGVTHLAGASTPFFKSIVTTLTDSKEYLVLWFGYRNIKYPVDGKSIGEAFDGIIFRGLWSTSMDKAVAEKYAGCPPNMIRADGVLFRIKVPKANVGEINGIDVRWLSTEKKTDHKEILLYDIPGKYVYVWKRCYFNQALWCERINKKNGKTLVAIEAEGE